MDAASIFKMVVIHYAFIASIGKRALGGRDIFQFFGVQYLTI